MRFPTGTEVQRLRGSERNFSRIYLGVQKGAERGDYVRHTTLMMGQHYQLVPADGYVAAEHLLYFSAVTLVGTDIRPNMSLLCGTAADPSAYGSVRIRAIGLGAGPGGADGLYLEPNDLRTNGYLVAGNHIWVDGVYRLYRKLPYIVTGTVYEDGNPDTALAAAGIPGYGLPFLDPASGNPDYMDRPIALMGSPRFAWTGENVDFYGWRSHGRGGNTIQNWTWDFDGGVCMGPGIGFPGSPASPIHVRWNSAGEYIASLVVEDNSGRAQIDDYGVPYDRHRAVRPVLVYDRPGEGDNTPYMNFEVESLAGKYGSGWSCKITVFGTADTTEFPDNALIIVYAEDWYGDQGGSIGGWYGQEGILFCGYIRSDSVTADFEKSTVSFTAQTIEQWMKDIGVWPSNCISTAGAPAAWHQFQAMAVEDVLWYLTEFRSNLKDVTDCFFASDVGAEKTLGFVDLTEASLYDQMSAQLGSCFFGKLSASRHGSIHLFKHKNMMDIGERTWWGPPVYSFSTQDWEGEIQIGEERQRDSVAQVDFIGFVYTATGRPLEVYSLAPARQTNFGGIEKVSGILLSGATIVGGQAENNTLAGLYLAWKNIRFPHITVPTRVNNRVLEPAEQDYFAVVLAANDTERGLIWAGKEFLTTGVSVKIDNENGIIDVDVEGEASTWGPDGVAGEYPPGEPFADPPGDNPGEYWPSWPPGETPENPAGDPPPWAEEGDLDFPITAYIAFVTGEVIRTTGIRPSTAGGQRVEFHNCGQVHSDGIYWMELDEFDPENTAMVCDGTRIHKTTNLSADTPNWDVVLTITTEPATEMNMVRSSSVQQGLWMIIGYGGTRIVVWWSTEGGAAGTWNTANFTSGNADGAWQVFLELSTHAADRAWAMWVDATDEFTYVGATDDMWATAPAQTVIPKTCFEDDSVPRPCCHHRAYDNADDSERIYGGTHFKTGTDYARIYKSPDCATLYTDAGDNAVVRIWMVGCGAGTRNRWWAIARGLAEQGFWASDDGITWVEQGDWDFAAGGDRWARDCKNLRGNWQWYLAGMDGTSYPLTVSIDRGVTWYTQAGGVGGGLGWAAFLTAEGLPANPDVVTVCPVEAPR